MFIIILTHSDRVDIMKAMAPLNKREYKQLPLAPGFLAEPARGFLMDSD